MIKTSLRIAIYKTSRHRNDRGFLGMTSVWEGTGSNFGPDITDHPRGLFCDLLSH
jgi:hypothetical protein